MFFSSRHRATALPVSLVDIWWDCCLLNAARVCVANKNNLDCGSVFFLFFFCQFTAIPPPQKKTKNTVLSFKFTVFWSSSVSFCHDIIRVRPLGSSSVTGVVEVEWLQWIPMILWFKHTPPCDHTIGEEGKKKKSRLFCLWFPQISERNHWATASHELWQWELLFAPGFGPVSPTGGDLLGVWILFFFVISFWLYRGRCDYCFLFSLLLE